MLDYAVFPGPINSTWVCGMNPKIVQCLLEHGADPNVKFNGYSAWSNALSYVAKYGFNTMTREHDTATHALEIVGVFNLLLAYGAAKKATCTTKSGKISAADVVREAISDPHHEYPQEALDGLREILAIIKNKKSARGKVKQALTITNDDDDNGEGQIAAAPFAGSSRVGPQNPSLPQKVSLSQRIKARLLKRRN